MIFEILFLLLTLIVIVQDFRMYRKIKHTAFEEGYRAACTDFYNGKLKMDRMVDSHNKIYFTWNESAIDAGYVTEKPINK